MTDTGNLEWKPFSVFYPIVPILAFINLLWMKPKLNCAVSEESYMEAEYRSVVAHAISGCIESPIQLIYQVSQSIGP